MVKRTLSDIITYLNNYRHYKNIPGLGSGMIDKGEIVLDKGFGIRQIDDLYGRVNSHTIFAIESITKSFTAQALMHLATHADFDLDQPMIRYLPYFKTKSGAYDQITTRQILSHTAGFPSNIWFTTLLDEGFAAFAKDMPEYRRLLDEQISDKDRLAAHIQTREDVTRYFAEIDLIATPGESRCHCSEAYMIAADVLEKVSGLTWETYVTKHILQPLGMTRTFFNSDFVCEDVNAASYYLKTIDASIETPQPHNEVGAPIGYMYSTVSDLLSFLEVHMKMDEKVMPRAAYKRMHAGHGLGWETTCKDGVKLLSHTGSYPGVSSYAAMIPEQQLAIVLLANTDSLQLEKVADKVMRMWSRQKKSDNQ